MPQDKPDGQSGRMRKLKRLLYSRRADSVAPRSRRDIHGRDFGVNEDWEPEEEKEKFKKKFSSSVVRILLISSVAFFVGAVALSTFFFFRVPAISPKNVQIEIQGPAQIGGGEELGLQIAVINRNPVSISNVDLIIEYPDGTRSAANINAELPRHRESIGSIKQGEEVRRTVHSILFGEEGSIKDIKVVVEFRVANSNAIFFNEASYKLLLSTSPLSLVVDTLEEAISGQDIVIEATITSNSKDVIKDVLFQIEYPFGFEFLDATPKSIFANRLWQLGDIPPEGEEAIRIRGTLVGQNGEERVFRFSTGIESESDPNTLESAFINLTESIFVKLPFITLDLALGGDTEGTFVTGGGKSVRGDITWTNNLPSQIFNTEIDVIFKGDVLNERSVNPERGFYESINNRIIWNRGTNPGLSSIPSGENGQVSFTFAPLGLSSGIPFRNPEIELDVSVRATRLSDTQVPEEIISTLTRRIKVSTDLILTSKALHFTGPLTNSGPIPPKVEQETSYTIVWTVTNSSNEVSDALVVATLPPFITWGDLVSSPTEDISYNPVGGQVIWNLGRISPGTGTVLPAREIAFQVKLLPSISQIGQQPTLINEQRITGFDVFAERELTVVRRLLSTRLNDPGFASRDANVVP